MSVKVFHILKIETKTSSSEGAEIRSKSAQALRDRNSLTFMRYRDRRRREIISDSVTKEGEQPVTSEITTGAVQPSPSRISAEWRGATGGPPAEVVLRLHPATSSTPKGNTTLPNLGGSGVVVRAEEALIVTFVLLLWIAAIALFFNRWGKIRCVYKLYVGILIFLAFVRGVSWRFVASNEMLEPYQPKFQQQHRQSCVLAENAVTIAPHARKISMQHRASLSRSCMSYDCGTYAAYQPCAYSTHRLRQNSVFVGSIGAMALIPESPPRRSRSAADLPALAPPSEHSAHATPRASRAASLHSAVDLRLCVPSPRTSRAASLHSTADMSAVQVHVRGSAGNLNRPRSPRRLVITNV